MKQPGRICHFLGGMLPELPECPKMGLGSFCLARFAGGKGSLDARGVSRACFFICIVIVMIENLELT
jgi:hypothetical protein